MGSFGAAGDASVTALYAMEILIVLTVLTKKTFVVRVLLNVLKSHMATFIIIILCYFWYLKFSWTKHDTDNYPLTCNRVTTNYGHFSSKQSQRITTSNATLSGQRPTYSLSKIVLITVQANHSIWLTFKKFSSGGGVLRVYFYLTFLLIRKYCMDKFFFFF